MKNITLDFKTYEAELNAAHNAGYDECLREMFTTALDMNNWGLAQDIVAYMELVENFTMADIFKTKLQQAWKKEA